MVKFEGKKLRKRRWKLWESEDKEKGIFSTQLAYENQGTHKRSGTVRKKLSVSCGAPAIKSSGSVVELLLAKKNRKKLPFPFRRPRLFRGGSTHT